MEHGGTSSPNSRKRAPQRRRVQGPHPTFQILIRQLIAVAGREAKVDKQTVDDLLPGETVNWAKQRPGTAISPHFHNSEIEPRGPGVRGPARGTGARGQGARGLSMGPVEVLVLLFDRDFWIRVI